MILLDTQALVWLLENDRMLGRTAARIEAESDRVLVSAVTFWELGLLVSRGRLTLSLPLEPWLEQITNNDRANIAPVTRDIALDAGLLAGGIHGDPGDRMLVATARALDCPLLTSDRRILDYAKAGHVQAIDARR